MKITSVDIILMKGNEPKNYSQQMPIFVKVNTDEGISGFGEAGVAYGNSKTAV